MKWINLVNRVIAVSLGGLISEEVCSHTQKA